MTGSEKISVTHRSDGTEEWTHTGDKDPPTRTGRNARRRRHKNQSGADSSGNGDRMKEDLESPQEDLRARFYEYYHRVVEDYNRESVGKYHKDLGSMFVSAVVTLAITTLLLPPHPNRTPESSVRGSPGGLWQVVARFGSKPFGHGQILAENSPKLMAKTFGLPANLQAYYPKVLWPQWTELPPTVVQVHAIHYISIAISLFALFLLMLVVLRWFPECAPVITRGPSIEHSQDRQRRLFRINHAMESLPSMLQIALLLRGCTLFHYLLETHPTISSVAIGITSFAAIFYLYIVIVGVVFPIWSHQPPGIYNPRRLIHIPGLLHSGFSASVEMSTSCYLLFSAWDALEERHFSIIPSTWIAGVITILPYIFLLPFCLLADAIRLYLGITSPFIIFARRAFFRLSLGSEHRTAMLDLRCISWTLRTSPDVHTRLSALNYLATMTPARFDTNPLMDCLNTFISCVKITNGKVTVIRRSEQLAMVSALCCLHTFSYLTVTDMVVTIEDIRQRYTKAFPSEVKFDGLQFSHVLGTIHSVFYLTRKFRTGIPTSMDQITLITWQDQLGLREHWWEDDKPSSDERAIMAGAFDESDRKAWRVKWDDYKPSSNEHVIVARALAKLSRFEYRRRSHWKVPRWLLRFVFHSLSQHPPPPTTVIIDCLSIIAIDLDCDFSNVSTPYESMRLDDVSRLITQRLETTVDPYINKSKAISVLLPYAALQERHVMLDALLDAVRTSNRSIWSSIVPALFNKASPLTIVLVSPWVDWGDPFLADRESLTTLWATATLAVPYTEEIGRSVVDALLHVSGTSFLRSRVPVGIWRWLEKQPYLPPQCRGRTAGGQGDVIRHVRALGDIKIFKSFLLLVWSEWDTPWPSDFLGTRAIIMEDFGGVEMREHREDLIKHLDHVLEQLNQGSRYLQKQKPRVSSWIFQQAKEEYTKIREVLLEVDKGVVGTRSQFYSTLTHLAL